MPTSTERDRTRVDAPPGQLRDGFFLLLLGLVVATWLIRGGDSGPATLGFAIAAWGLALAGQALWLRSRRRT